MKKSIQYLLAALSLMITISLSAQTVKSENLEILCGDVWKGELTYKNYGDGKLVTLPVELTVTKLSDASFEFAYNYTNEQSANSKSKIKIKSGGTVVFGQEVESVEANTEGQIVIVTTSSGKDGGKKSKFNFTYQISQKTFIMRKDVTFEGETESFMRNEYRFSR